MRALGVLLAIFLLLVTVYTLCGLLATIALWCWFSYWGLRGLLSSAGRWLTRGLGR